MDDNRFAEVMRQERERLNRERDEIIKQQQDLENKLGAINREFEALDAYEAAKTGRPTPPARKGRGTRAQPQGRRGSRRAELLQLIHTNPGGLKRGEILDRMGLKGNKPGEMSVSNALTALTKANQVVRREGKYVPHA